MTPADRSPGPNLDLERAVRQRYAAASRAVEPALCCPVSYRAEYLKVLPAEVLERDYGCGDPSRWLAEGDRVLDLGSGGGKICYIASQVVGPRGHVLGIDMTDEMLSLARRHRETVGTAIGWHNVEFRKARIQDLALDLEAFDTWLAAHPVRGVADWLVAEAEAERMRREAPLVPPGSIDAIVSNCVLNLVRTEDRWALFREMARVLAPGGRVVVSDIVSDRPVPEALRRDPELWSGCISGAMVEGEFLAALAAVGLERVEVVARQVEPWAVVEGIEFRSVSVRAYQPRVADGLSDAATTSASGTDRPAARAYTLPTVSASGNCGPGCC